MTAPANAETQHATQEVALIVGGGPGISASCARLFADSGMRVAIAARNPDKPILVDLQATHGVHRYACDASDPASVASLFERVVQDLGAPALVVHNIDGRVPGIFGKRIRYNRNVCEIRNGRSPALCERVHVEIGRTASTPVQSHWTLNALVHHMLDD